MMYKIAFITLLSVILPACSPNIVVHTDCDPDFDLFGYHTFYWAKHTITEAGKNSNYTELNDSEIRSAVQKQLINRGYELTQDKPDLILFCYIITENQSMVETEPHEYFHGLYWLQAHTYRYQHRENTLILDLMDSRTNNLVWRGQAVYDINNLSIHEQIEHIIKKAIPKIFKNFPKTAKHSHATKPTVSQRY